jgi:hypothetical protein
MNLAILDSAHIVTSIALAQQNLIGGHMLLPVMKPVLCTSERAG